MDASIAFRQLEQARDGEHPPLVVDVRSEPAFRASPHMMAGALRRDPEAISAWADELPSAASIVVCCAHGHEVSQAAARALRARGRDAHYLEGGIEHWREAGGGMLPKPAGAPTRWVTRERPKVDRIACPWLVSRFIDRNAEFLYVPSAKVKRVAQAQQATPYDIPDVQFSHDGELCSFDAFLRIYRLTDPELDQLALIVRGADTARPDLAPQAAGLVSLSLGLSRRFADDHEMLRHGMIMYDALYLWCREGRDVTRTWNPEAYRAAAGA